MSGRVGSAARAPSLVAEFSPATLGARLGLSTYAARELMAHALDLSMRLPRLWGRVQALPETAVLPG